METLSFMRGPNRFASMICASFTLSLLAALAGCPQDVLDPELGAGPPANGNPDTQKKYGDVQNPPFLMASEDRAQVYLLLGLWDVYSLGFNDLAAQMRSRGLRAVTLSGTDWPALAQEIIRAHKNGKLRGDLIFVGHSFGGDDAVDIAILLKEQGISVRGLALLESTFPAPIPVNVDRCFHLYKPNLAGDLFPNTFAGNPVTPEPGNTHTEIINKLINFENFEWEARRMEHFTIDSHPLAQLDLIRQVEAMIKDQPAPP